MGGNESKEYIAAVRSLVDIYAGNFENEPVLRDAGDASPDLHLVSGVFVYNPKLKKFLVQQRAATKATYPSHFTDSASGHVNARRGMSLATIKEEMCRELAEEMGVEAKPGQLRLWTFFQDPEVNEIKFEFVARTEQEEVHPDLSEVTARSGWFDAATLRAMLRSERFVGPVINLWSALLENEARFDAFLKGLEGWQTYWNWCGDLRAFVHWARGEGEGGAPRERPRSVPLFLGRFQPFHIGHQKCLERIGEQARDVVIAIGSAQYARDQRNPLAYDERRDAIRHAIEREGLGFENVFFVPVPDIHNERLWMQNIKLLFGDSVVMVSNNDWVRGLAEGAGIRLAAKMAFEVGKLNGSNARELIRAGGDWRALVPDPRYMEERGLVEIIRASK
ncbi:MAG: adenylyltransferase/cytidyltransferase family protein [Candidatus Lokiarchaeota archaeon]|nr:adenylyltransferase/cytidyltransferase family protein [Candidatus Lokiarchaeota archaeon]